MRAPTRRRVGEAVHDDDMRTEAADPREGATEATLAFLVVVFGREFTHEAQEDLFVTRMASHQILSAIQIRRYSEMSVLKMFDSLLLLTDETQATLSNRNLGLTPGGMVRSAPKRHGASAGGAPGSFRRV